VIGEGGALDKAHQLGGDDAGGAAGLLRPGWQAFESVHVGQCGAMHQTYMEL